VGSLDAHDDDGDGHDDDECGADECVPVESDAADRLETHLC